MATIIPWKRRARVSDEDFERMLRPHLQAMYRLAWRLLRNRADAEDLVQEVVMRLCDRRDELVAVESLRPWLMRVLYNRFVDEQRRRGRQVPLFEGQPDEEVLDQVADEGPDPQALLQRMQDTEALQAALDALPEIHRQVLILHDVEGYTLKEVAGITDAPVGTLKSRLNRARSALKQKLSETMEPFAFARRVGK
ncbi:MAG: RNA polymerase sigma factor [Gammaproteobacteria bacterium]|nr:MAG: RNA polymerase sigma factor [Gammaproteobacteria bacterium]